MFQEREVLKKELWQRAEDALFALYGEKPDARILNRLNNEKMIFGETDAIIVWDIVADIRIEAKLCGHLTNLIGTDSSCFGAYLMGASDINPLELHYHCSECGKIEFIENKHALPWDIADKVCKCGHAMCADGFDIPHELHIGSAKAHLTVAPPIMEIAEKIIRERVRGIYSCISRIRRSASASVTFTFGGKHDENLPGIDLVASAEYDEARRLTDATGMDFNEIMTGISGHYLSDPRLVSEFAGGKTEGVIGLDFNTHPHVGRMKEDLRKASPKTTYDLLNFLGTACGMRSWRSKVSYAPMAQYMSTKAAMVGVLRIALAVMWYKVNCTERRLS